MVDKTLINTIRRAGAIALILLFSNAFPCVAQIKLDVKTTFEEKCESILPKAGLIAYLKTANWANVVEIGEDASVWVRNYSMSRRGDVLWVSVDVELRTPAMITHGRLIDRKHIETSVRVSSYQSGNNQQILEAVTQALANSSQLESIGNYMVNKLIVHIAKNNLMVYVIRLFLGELDICYSEYRNFVLEGMVLGAVLTEAVADMLKWD